jgi:hypothetical protein
MVDVNAGTRALDPRNQKREAHFRGRGVHVISHAACRP